MNRLLITLVLILSCSTLLQARDGYLKFTKDTELSGKKFYRGEIYPISKEIKEKNTIYFAFYSEELTPGKNAKKMDIEPDDKTQTKNDYVQLKDSNYIYIDVKSLNKGNDTIWLVSEMNVRKSVISPMTLKKEDCGHSFRLIIPNSPTLLYSLASLSNLKKTAEQQDSDGDGVLDINDKCPNLYGTVSNNGCPGIVEKGFFASLEWWHYIVFVLILGGIIIGAWKYFNNRKLNPNEVRFKGNSLTEFANCYGGLNKLNTMNPGVIPTQKEWLSLKNNEREKQNLINKLKGQKILIKSENATLFGFDDLTSNANNSQIEDDEANNNIEMNINLTNAVKDTISIQLTRLERNIINEIQRTTSRSNENSNELSRLKTEIGTLKSDNIKFRTDNQNLDSKIIQLVNEKELLDRSINSLNEEKNKKGLELKQLQEIVITANFLSGYCESVIDYFKLCKDVINDAYSYFNRISQLDIQQASILGHLLTKFQISINSIPVGNWLQIIQDIKDTGATANKKLIRSFSQIQSEEEKKREFQRLLFSDVLIKYSSCILILAEEFRNLVNFNVPEELAIEAHRIFSKHVSELNIKIKSTGLENKYVPLFQNFEKFLGNIESVGKEKNLAYKGINGLEKGAIAEIISYGIKTSFEDTKTQIILA